jgi:hypothetical protein
MTKEEFEAYQARHQHAGRPVLAALVEQRPADEDAFRGTGEKAESGKRKKSPCCPVCGLENECVCPGGVAAGQEINLHNEIIKECRRRGWVYVHSNPSKRTRQTLGTPDFIIYAAGGVVLNVECKTERGALSKEQKNFRRNIEALGHVYHVVRGVDVFKMIAHNIAPLKK